MRAPARCTTTPHRLLLCRCLCPCVQVREAAAAEAVLTELEQNGIAGSFKPCPGCNAAISKCE